MVEDDYSTSVSSGDLSVNASEAAESSSKAKNLRIATGALLFIGIFILAIGGGIFYFASNNQKGEDIKIIAPEAESVKAEQLVVHVDGAVFNPGVYTLEAGSRIGDLVTKAGGLTEEADSARINLAAKVADGQKIQIAKIGQAASGTVAGAQANGLIGINGATTSQLNSLPGVGDVTSSKIIAGRPYSSIDELKSKKIVSSGVFEKIRELISVD